MKKIIAVCVLFVLGMVFLSSLNSGCGSSSTAPVTVTQSVTITQVATPACGAQLGYGTLNSGFTGITGYIDAYPVTLSSASKTLDMAIYVGTTAAGNIGLAVYSDSSGVPHTLLDSGTITAPVASSWNVAPLAGVNLAAGKYWLAMQVSASNTLNYGANYTVGFYECSFTYGAYPGTFPAGASFTANPRAILLDTVCQ